MNSSKYDFLKKQLQGSYRYLFSALVFILVGSFFSFLGPKLIGVSVDRWWKKSTAWEAGNFFSDICGLSLQFSGLSKSLRHCANSPVCTPQIT